VLLKIRECRPFRQTDCSDLANTYGCKSIKNSQINSSMQF
jgi:hypothetical protein